MKNKSEFFGLLSNIGAVILLLAFIVLGLNKIGVYSLPASIEKLLGTYESQSVMEEDDNSIYNSFEFDKDIVSFAKAEIRYESAMSLLQEVSVSDDYSQHVSVEYYYDESVLTELLDIFRKDGLYDVIIRDASGNKKKHLVETADSLMIESFAGNDVYSSEFVKGDFQVSDECGFVLTLDELMKSDPVLDESVFFVRETENDVFLDITFDTPYSLKQQTMTYTVSLKYGVVTDVLCMEDGKLVYSMKTLSIEDNLQESGAENKR